MISTDDVIRAKLCKFVRLAALTDYSVVVVPIEPVWIGQQHLKSAIWYVAAFARKVVKFRVALSRSGR
jgi:hypothetical protein